MILLLAAVAIVFATTIAFSPFILWQTYLTIWSRLLASNQVPLVSMARMAWDLLCVLLLSPLFSLGYLVDLVFCRGYLKQEVVSPVFIIGQPRSGTTFLHRSLSENRHFRSLSHLEWRFPFVWFWKLIDRIGLRTHLERIEYWPRNDIGRRAMKMHEHRLGSLEEHGMFLEERFLHHFFLFRRFPFPEIIDQISSYQALSKRDQERILLGIKTTVQKALYYQNASGIWLTKENESVELYELLSKVFPDARYVFIARRSKDFLESYADLSIASTEAKTGIDPRLIEGWDEANSNFRVVECQRMIEFYEAVRQTSPTLFVEYDAFIRDISGTVRLISESFEVPLSEEDEASLRSLDRLQQARNRGYSRATTNVAGIDFFDAFIKANSSNFEEAANLKK